MKENNPFMAHQSSAESVDQIPSQPLDLNNNPHPSKHVINMEKQQQAARPFFLNTLLSHDDDRDDNDVTQKHPSAASKLTNLINKEEIALQEETVVVGEDSGRERLKRHRVEVAGSVWIPEIWGQEELLKDWIDCSAFDDPLVPSRISTAREALVEEGRRANAAGLSIENRC